MPDSSPPTQGAALRLALACDFEEVRRTADTVRTFLTGQGCSSADVMDCDLALVEACNNAIEYAPAAARKQAILLEAVCRPEEIELRITDHTAGFDLPRSPALPNPDCETGRGLFLIQKLMHQVDYVRGHEGNTLTLRKRRAQSLRGKVLA